MSVIILDGAEKVGKTTLINILASQLRNSGYMVTIRKQSGRAVPDERMYEARLLQDVSYPVDRSIAIWDRAWPSEYVYGNLIHQDRPMVKNPLAGELRLGLLAEANGLRVMVTGVNATILSVRRDSSDLPVDPAEEQKLYEQYARMFGWTIATGVTTIGEAEDLAGEIIKMFFKSLPKVTPLPPYYIGKPDAETIVIATRFNDKIKEQWQEVGLEVGWVIAHGCPPHSLRGAKNLIAYGDKPYLWAKNYILQEGGLKQKLVLGSDESNVNQIINQIRKG
jgi:hypothetical protein